ncbi:hypothetical protein L211DRAFT_852445 [Terfezia boudieri ATCC MYA-4762]|uniref:Uncharacterized protein n=1 Tax=Terfezia boudieri ATCC MYA-4762 TaxID=1051890 RepID=A0A3N4LQR1_9PEZI|nr:hypothetical protein L211DRAFT_852445 [Terfezia boudieri ATCC MYA-4762]
MVRRLPKPNNIVLKEIRNALNKLDIPTYYRGSVSGNGEEGYSYVVANAPETKANYRLGEKLSSEISNKFIGPFDSTIDAQQAELELEAYRWNLLDKKALSVVPFRGYITRLCMRPGKATWGSKCKAIRNTFPDWLKKQIKMTIKDCQIVWTDPAPYTLSQGIQQMSAETRTDLRKLRRIRTASSKPTNKASSKLIYKASRKPTNKASSKLIYRASGKLISKLVRHSRSRPQQQQAGGNNRWNNNNTTPANYTDTYPLFVNLPAPPSFANPISPSALIVSVVVFEEEVDEQSTVVAESDQKIELLLYHVLTQNCEKREVFSLPSPSDSMLAEPVGILHSLTKSPGGQNLLTVWDTGTLLSLVPMSTIKALNLIFVSGSDVAFIVANGSKM